jgi:hypothetical protein
MTWNKNFCGFRGWAGGWVDQGLRANKIAVSRDEVFGLGTELNPIAHQGE